MRMLSLLVLALASLTGSAIAHACMHPFGAMDSRVRVSQSGQQALILFHDGVEELVLKVDYAFDDDSYQGAAPAALAWVIPVPSIPTHYSAKPTELFAALDEWVELQDVRVPPRVLSPTQPRPRVSRSALQLLPTVEVGPFEIQPIRAQGEGAGEALNEWMREHSFAEIPNETMEHYLARRWTFLAVRASADEALDASGSLPPLGIRFATDRPVYPFKFSTHMGTFPVRAYLVTAEDLPDSAFAGATRRGFVVAGTGRRGDTGHLGNNRHGPDGGRRYLRTQVREFRVDDAPPPLRPLLGELGLGVQSSLFLRVLRHRNLAGETIAGWDEDLAFPAYANQEEATAAPFSVEELAPPEAAHTPEALPAPAEPAPSAVRESDGCACRIAAAQGGPPAGLVLIAFLSFWRRRRG